MTKSSMLLLDNGMFDPETLELTPNWVPGVAWDPEAKASFPADLERHVGAEDAAYLQDWLRRGLLCEHPEPIHVPGVGGEELMYALREVLHQAVDERFLLAYDVNDPCFKWADGRAVIILGGPVPEGVRSLDLDWYEFDQSEREAKGWLTWIATPGPLALGRVKSALLR